MAEPPDLDSIEPCEAIARKVREASRRGRLLPLGEAWQGKAEDFAAWKQSWAEADMGDIGLIRERGGDYLYSQRHMTRAYAETAARAACDDVCWVIAQTVRGDSRLYPRPTPIEAFENAPFLFSKDVLDRALRDIHAARDYADILLVKSSSGALYLFSSLHMTREHAESLAEWFSVGSLQNP
jgi:hypothetical protein